MNTSIHQLLGFVYGQATADRIQPRVAELIERYRTQITSAERKQHYFDQRDAVLITYGDMVHASGEAPLATLNRFLQQYIQGLINTVHILPFYPYTSDDGFSVTDYRRVNPDLGDWNDIAALDEHFKLMFDAVINHISAQSDWFQGFLAGEERYRDYFICVDPATDLSTVFRPRASPLLTPFQTAAGEQHVWTTFSADQIDLNFGNPEVLLDILDVLLGYVQKGAQLIRLDAIGFMWKEIGTPCIHQPQAHALIQLMRAVLDEVSPATALVTETNVPHKDNISYFGDGTNEAQMVYNFSLPPLTLHAFHTGDASVLSDWAATLDLPSQQTTFFNFLASHDGIGVTPARGILPTPAIDALAKRVEQLGGFVSYRATPQGEIPYELNINYLDALGAPGEASDNTLRACRFLAAQAIMLALRGVPGIYFHSLFGSRSWTAGVAQTGQKRTINREKLDAEPLNRELVQTDSLRSQVFQGLQQLLQIRTREAAFHPNGGQQILRLQPEVFAVLRTALDDKERILCLQNVSNRAVTVDLQAADIPQTAWHDLLGEASLAERALTLSPYAVRWLKAH